MSRRGGSGSAWRRGRRRGVLGAADVLGRAACSTASCASRSASSSRSVSWNIWRCSASIASLLAPYFQRFRRQLEGDLLELRVAPGDVAVLALDQLLLDLELSCLLLDALEHLRGQRRDGLGRQTLQVLSLEIAHAE